MLRAKKPRRHEPSQAVPRWSNTVRFVHGERVYFPFNGKPIKFKGYDLGRYNDYSLIEFRSGMMVFGGVNIAEPSSLEITPANAK